MRSLITLGVTFLLTFAVGEENVCTENVESYVGRIIVKRSFIPRCNPWHRYHDCPAWRSYHEFHHPIWIQPHMLNTKQTITCGATTNVTLPLVYPNERKTCTYCNAISLELKQLNGEVLPASAFPGFKEVTEFHLNNLLITHLTPGAFNPQENLTKIYLSNNNISEVPVGVFNNIPKLTELDLSCNKIRDINSYMLNTTKISPISLNMSHNEIDFIEKKVYETLFFNLSSLDLSFNKIHNFNIDYITSNISSIFLSHNNLSKIIGCLYKIPKLVLSHNALKVIENNCRDDILSLNYLDVSHNAISKLNFETFPRNFGIKTLLLQFNSISNITIGTFSHLEQLQTLNLSFNKISFLSQGSFENLIALTQLDISNNCLKSLDFKTLHSLPTLYRLDIQNNMIGDFKYVELLERFPMLKTVNMDNNKFTCDNLMEAVFYLDSKSISIVYGSTKYQENVQGMACHSKQEKLQYVEEDTKTPEPDFLQQAVSYYHSEISLFWIGVVFLTLLLLMLIFQTYVLYYKCPFRPLENVELQ